MQNDSNKPPYYDGSGMLKQPPAKTYSNDSKPFVITPEMQKQLSGNPYIIHGLPQK